MAKPTVPVRRWLFCGLVLTVATVAAAQRFVWPPVAGDQMALPQQPAASLPLEEEDSAAPTDAGFAAEPPMSVAARPEVFGAQPIPATPPSAMAQPAAGGANRLDWQILENPNGPKIVMIFDPVRQVFAVYHVDAASGQIMLKSVRNLSADLRLEQFNSGAPAPKDIQAMLDEAR